MRRWFIVLLLATACSSQRNLRAPLAQSDLNEVNRDFGGDSVEIQLANAEVHQGTGLRLAVDRTFWYEANGGNKDVPTGTVSSISAARPGRGFIAGLLIGPLIGGAVGYTIGSGVGCASKCEVPNTVVGFLGGALAGGILFPLLGASASRDTVRLSR